MDRFGGSPAIAENIRNPVINKKLAEEEGAYEDILATEPADESQEDQPIEDRVIVDSFRAIWDMEDIRFAPIKAKIADAWDQYHRTWEEPKDPDQTDQRFPSALLFVEKIAATVIRMVAQENWLSTESLIPQQQILINMMKRFALFSLEHDDSNFWTNTTEALKSGIITGQCITQILPSRDGINLLAGELDEDQDMTDDTGLGFWDAFTDVQGKGGKPFIPNPMVPKVTLENIPTDMVRLDSSRGDRYVMWTAEVPIGSVFAEAAARGYDVNEIKLARDRRVWPTVNNSTTERVREGMGIDSRPGSGMMRLHFFEGTMDDLETGARIFTKKICVMANGCRIILQPTEIPFWDGKPSCVIAPFISAPHNVHGKGLLSENVDAFASRNNILNLLMDYMRRVLCPAYEEDQDIIDEEEMRKPRRLYPGAIIKVRDSRGQPCYRAVTPGDMPSSFWNIYQTFETQHASNTGQDTGIGGAVRTRGRQTADEFKTRNSEAGTMFFGIFKEWEARYLSPVIKLYILRQLQYTPQDMWSTWVLSEMETLVGNFEDVDEKTRNLWREGLKKVAAWDPITRYKRLAHYFSFRVRVFSNLAERQAEIEKIFFMLRSLAAVPGAIQTLNLPKVVRKGVEAFGWDPEEVMRMSALPPPDFDGKLPAAGSDNQEPDDVPDLSGGGFEQMGAAMGQGAKPPTEGLFPGGPIQPVANPPKPLV